MMRAGNKEKTLSEKKLHAAKKNSMKFIRNPLAALDGGLSSLWGMRPLGDFACHGGFEGCGAGRSGDPSLRAAGGGGCCAAG
jgi:hypothetical protein